MEYFNVAYNLLLTLRSKGVNFRYVVSYLPLDASLINSHQKLYPEKSNRIRHHRLGAKHRRWPSNNISLFFNISGYPFLTRQLQVEGEVQGEDTRVQKLLKDIDQGPRYAHVTKLEKTGIETADGEETFEVRR